MLLKVRNKEFSFLALLGYLVAALISLVVLRDVVRFIVLANHGYNLTDEAFYLSSYATRNDVGRSFTGATFIIGPIFDLLGHDIARLRILKVFLLVLAGGFIGYQTVQYIKNVVGKKYGKSYERAEILGYEIALVACSCLLSFSAYFWAPVSLNYNDLNTLFLLTIGGTIIRLFRFDKFDTFPWISIMSLGFLGAMALYNKPSSGAVISIFIIMALILTWRKCSRGYLVIPLSAAGFFIFVAFISMSVNSLSVFPDSYAFLQVIREESYDLTFLITNNVRHIKVAFDFLINKHLPVYIWGAVVIACTARLPRKFAILGGLVAVAPFIKALANKMYFSGGVKLLSSESRYFVAEILLVSVFFFFVGFVVTQIDTKIVSTSMAAIKERRLPSRSSFELFCVTLMLFSIPFIQAFGTYNELFLGSAFSIVSWFLFIVILIACMGSNWSSGTALCCIAVLLVIGMRCKILEGFLQYPYLKQDPVATMKYRVDSDRLRGIKMSSQWAQYLNDLIAIKNENGIKDGSAYLSFYNNPGEIYALGGYTPGEPWYIDWLTVRNANSIRFGCNRGNFSDEDPPIILKWEDTTLDHKIIAELQRCRVDFPDGYRIAGESFSPLFRKTTQFYVPISPESQS